MKTFCILAASFLLVVAAGPGRVSGLTMTTLHSFGGGDGLYPSAGLVQGTDGWFYGTATYGGTNNGGGTVFKASAQGGFAVLYDFDGNATANPHAGLVRGTDGNFYGTTLQHYNGTVFRVSPQGAFTNLYSFGGAPDGSEPWAGLILGSDSNFYGTTQYGGGYTNTFPDGCGTVYRITPAGVLTNLYQFTGGADGYLAYGGLVEGGPGTFYGTTLLGGTHSEGVVFKLTSAGTFTTLHSFDYTNGALPSAGLVYANDGNFYGTTTGGGLHGSGTVYRISASGAFTNLYNFGDVTNGAFPYDALIQGSDSNFYGTTQFGGFYGQGTLFEITPQGTLTTLWEFTGGADGGGNKVYISYAGLAQDSAGNFYGTCAGGGLYGDGNVFQLSFAPPLKQITGIQVAGTNVVVLIKSAEGETYQLQASDSLDPANWVDTGGAITGMGVDVTLTNVGGALRTQELYRVVISP